MGAPEWIALLGPIITLAGVGLGLVVKLTRLIDAVNDLKTTMVGLVRTDRKHEKRIRRLERLAEDGQLVPDTHRPRRLHRPP